MVSIKTDINYLNKCVGQKLTIEQLSVILFDIGFELENVEGDEVTIEITAERSDAISTQGIARIIKSYVSKTPIFPEWKVMKSKFKVIVDDSVSNVRPKTVCAVVKGLKLNNDQIKEMINVQEKLHQTYARNRKKGAIGIYPMEHVKMPIYYKALTPSKIKFLPLESDHVMTAIQILNEHPTGIKYQDLLKGNSKYPIFIDSNNETMSMPPIINSEKTGRVTELTNDIFIECSGFDINNLNNMLNILVAMFSDMGGTIHEVTVEYSKGNIITPNLQTYNRSVDLLNVNKMLGLDLSMIEVKKLLTKMMYKVKSVKGNLINVEVPVVRVDIWHNVDIIDDVARGYGFNNFVPKFPNISTIGGNFPLSYLKEQLCELMVGQGYLEFYTLALTSNDDQYSKMEIKSNEHVELLGSEEKGINMVRTWLLPELLKSLHNNRNRSYPQHIFESGIVVLPDKDSDVNYSNQTKLAMVRANHNVSFTDARQVLDALLNSIGIEPEIKPVIHNSFIKGRVGEIIVKGKVIGIIGELSPQVLTNWELVMPTVGFEINVDKLMSLIA